MPGFLRNIGTAELIIIALIILLLFGGKKINELARGLGESKREVKKIKNEIKGKKGSDEETS
jgi:sec-independent protein translocase protein TatA